jgi:trk system potassium uptake protein TrkA
MDLIIIGCGRLGSELAYTVSQKGHNVIVIDRDANAFHRLDPDFCGRTIQGDVRDREVLVRAGIEGADGFAAVTSSDEINLVAANAAQDIFKVPNVVARVYDPSHATVFKRAGVQTVISSSWGAHRIEQLLTHPGITELASLGNGEVLLLEIQIPDHMIGKSIADLASTCVCQPTALVRGGHAELAKSATLLEDGDLLILAILSSNLPQLEQVIQLRGP